MKIADFRIERRFIHMKLITLTLLSFATASSTLSLDPKNSDKFPDTEIQVEQLTPTERLFKEVSEDFMMDGEPIHPMVLHEFYPDIWRCGGNPVATINLSDIWCDLTNIECLQPSLHKAVFRNGIWYTPRVGEEEEIDAKAYVIFNCGLLHSHSPDECRGYLLYRTMHIRDDGAHLVFLASNTGGSGVVHSYLHVKPIIKTMHKGTTQLTSDDEQIYELGAKEYVALELIGFYDQEPTFMEHEK